MIEIVKGIETKIVINLRNYLIVNYNKEKLRIVISTIYETITPLDIEISFTIHRSEQKFQKYLDFFSEIIKLGKI
jgi:uncharacterized protein with HEPN domain